MRQFIIMSKSLKMYESRVNLKSKLRRLRPIMIVL